VMTGRTQSELILAKTCFSLVVREPVETIYMALKLGPSGAFDVLLSRSSSALDQHSVGVADDLAYAHNNDQAF